MSDIDEFLEETSPPWGFYPVEGDDGHIEVDRDSGVHRFIALQVHEAHAEMITEAVNACHEANITNPAALPDLVEAVGAVANNAHEVSLHGPPPDHSYEDFANYVRDNLCEALTALKREEDSHG